MDFVTRVFPKLQMLIPAHSFLACVFGAILIAAGVAIMIEKVARSSALLLGVVILSLFALPYLTLLITMPLLPFNIRLWARAGKALALAGKFQFGAAIQQAIVCRKAAANLWSLKK
jgi:hypothetical protein